MRGLSVIGTVAERLCERERVVRSLTSSPALLAYFCSMRTRMSTSGARGGYLNYNSIKVVVSFSKATSEEAMSADGAIHR